MLAPWVSLGLLVVSATITAAATALAARMRRRSPTAGRWPAAFVAASRWVLILFLCGLVAVRYVERVSHAALAYGVLALVACLLSLAHALLFRRILLAQSTPATAERPSAHYIAFLTTILLALVLAAVPIAASDLFRMPYSPAWRTINRTIDRLHYTYNPPGGGEAPVFPPWRNPGDAGLAYSDVMLTTSDGLHLAAWFVPASTSEAPTVLLAHGLQDSKWTLLRLIPWLHDAGYNVMAFDFRGHGESDKRPTTLGPKEALDVEAALDWLQAHGVGDQVVGLGQSLGAAALLNASVQDGRLKALVLDSLFAEWKNVDYGRGYRLPPEWLVPGVPDPVDLIRRVHVPVLIIHGTADTLVGVDHAYRLYEAANEPRVLWINDSGHAWSAWTYPELYREKVLGFLKDALQAPGKKKG
jgi:uncharacterized protein